MTSNNVSRILDSAGAVQKKSGRVKTQGIDGAFSMLLNPSTSGEKYESTSQLMQSTLKTSGSDAKQVAYQKEKSDSAYMDRKVAQTDAGRDYDQLSEEISDKTDDLAEKITDILTEKLNVTEEELLQAMEQLNLGFLDLLDVSNLSGLVMELTGTEDISGLLFSDEFQMLLADFGTLTQELMDELGLTQDELQNLLQQMTRKNAEPGALPNEVTVSETPGNADMADLEQTQIPAEMPDDQPEAEQTAVKEPLTGKPETRPDAAAAQNKTGKAAEAKAEETGKNTSVKTENPVSTEQEAAKTAWDAEDNQGQAMKQDGGSGQETGKNQTPQMAYQTVQTTTTVAMDGGIAQVVQQTYVDVEDVMRQITQFTRIQVNPTESSMEMQLNPAHLGKIYLQVASRDGVITAQLAAQNEAVKEALESQMAVLKENLNQQGLKVEAVEVTIASHEFEQNLQGNRQSESDQQSRQEQSGSRRNLTKDSLGDLEGLMSEEENLAAKIMLENGNSMDMTV